MAQTCYRNYLWLITTLEGNTYGYTLNELQEEYGKFRYHLEKSVRDGKFLHLKGSDILPRTTFITWRSKIYEHFGLIINPIQGTYRYILENPDLLDASKTLRESIKHLAEEEERKYQVNKPLESTKRGRKPKNQNTDSMGFISIGSEDIESYDPYVDTYGDTPDMVSVIRFSMTFGESLVIHYGKVNGVPHRDKQYVLEPQQLICTDGKWYVAGYIYEYGESDPHKSITIYDIDRIRLCEDEESISPHYTLNENFDIFNQFPVDWNEHFDHNKVVSLYLRTSFSLDSNPFCQAQMKVDNINIGLIFRLYKVFLKPDRYFWLKYLAYGDELKGYYPYDKVTKTETDLSDYQVRYLNQLRRKCK